jgi:D-alanyl-D-alanine carboxypeptidase-like protein
MGPVLIVVVLASLLVGRMVSRGDAIVRPPDVCATPPTLMTRGHVTLQPNAMRAYQQAQRLSGGRITVVQSYRSCSAQALACLSICGDENGCPGTCARPGTSYHQFGAAIDVNAASLASSRVFRALRTTGWCQPLPNTDPGHFSFGGCH